MNLDDFKERYGRGAQSGNDSGGKSKARRIASWVLCGALAILLIIVIINSATRVNPGYAGVKYSLLTGMKDDIEHEGLIWHAPWIKIYEYPVSTETVALRNAKKGEDKEDTSLQVNTGDGKSVAVDVRYAYSMQEEKLPHIFKRFRRQDAEWIAENYIKAEILNITQSITTSHSVLEVYSQNREDIAKEVRERLNKSLAEDGIKLEKFTFSDVRPDEKTQTVLQQVADTENKRELLKREEENLKQEQNNIAQQKENDKLSAEKDKEIAKVNAEKEAETILINANAQAEANEKLSKSVSDTLVDYEIAKKADKITWPKVYGGGNMLQLPGNFLDDAPAEEKKDE